MIPLFWCYTVGKLNDDMGDHICAEPRFSAYTNDNGVDEGRYDCQYKGKPCTLYVGKIVDPSIIKSSVSKRRIRGYCLYNDDAEAYKYVQGILGNLGAIKSPSTYSNSFR